MTFKGGGGLAVRAPAAPLPVLAFAFKPVLVPRPSAYRSAKCWSGAMPNLICTSNGITCRHLGVGMILLHHSRRALGRFEVLSFALEVFDPQEAASVQLLAGISVGHHSPPGQPRRFHTRQPSGVIEIAWPADSRFCDHRLCDHR